MRALINDRSKMRYKSSCCECEREEEIFNNDKSTHFAPHRSINYACVLVAPQFTKLERDDDVNLVNTLDDHAMIHTKVRARSQYSLSDADTI